MDRDFVTTARTLSEALPYMQRYAGAVVVVKFGGNAMGDDAAMAEFAKDIVLMKQVGIHPVVVHGGGPMINDLLNRLGIESRFVRGKRVTTPEAVQVVEMVLSGLVNKRIVQAINDAGGRAIGISGKDDDLMVCEADDPELGFVGRPIEMNVQIIRDLYLAGLIPVIAPVATGMADNETFNVNGDTAAGAIAGALKADRLLLLTDVAGVKDGSGQVLTQIHPDQVRTMIADGTIAGGMIPKTETALAALDEGVRAVVILDGRVPHAALLELFTEQGAGSLIRSTEPRVKPHGLRQGGSGL
ncbi:acetylglutamate kinase [Paracoccus sp. (in: a-proteobacteria)]|uniref:acetylglutamate kinase n=1 Tax=Paracoccus sp. TaxID=267 RepID=UPI0026E0CD79|nr:acetylglutamate kinase [Paracoccus sp. (in: a-proteobacteria)]MDO5369493.1 acetylglutamate kinase [Paracoccus sp. (in: a-proteobacteria)]